MRLLLAVALVACTSDDPMQQPDASLTTDAATSECAAVTMYKGSAVTCDSGRGLCVVDRGEVACRPQCADISPACTDGSWWRTILLADGTNACYCEPGH